MQGVEHRPGHVPVEVVRGQVQGVAVGEQTRQAFRDLGTVLSLDADVDFHAGSPVYGRLHTARRVCLHVSAREGCIDQADCPDRSDQNCHRKIRSQHRRGDMARPTGVTPGSALSRMAARAARRSCRCAGRSRARRGRRGARAPAWRTAAPRPRGFCVAISSAAELGSTVTPRPVATVADGFERAPSSVRAAGRRCCGSRAHLEHLVAEAVAGAEQQQLVVGEMLGSISFPRSTDGRPASARGGSITGCATPASSKDGLMMMTSEPFAA